MLGVTQLKICMRRGLRPLPIFENPIGRGRKPRLDKTAGEHLWFPSLTRTKRKPRLDKTAAKNPTA